MNTHDIASIAMLKKSGLTVCVSESTGTNIALSIRTAEHIAKTSAQGNVLYINTVQTSRQLASSIRAHADPEFSEMTKDPRITYESSPYGLILDEEYHYEAQIAKREITYVIINSWEFASKDYRRKGDLIFLLNRWMEKYGMTVLVFAEKMKSAPECQKIQTGRGVGKLAAIAQEVKVFREKAGEESEIGKESEVRAPKSEVGEEGGMINTEIEEEIEDEIEEEIEDEIEEEIENEIEEEYDFEESDEDSDDEPQLMEIRLAGSLRNEASKTPVRAKLM